MSVGRIDPGEEPRLAFDSLVNPLHPMGATLIHGITDADVARAPRYGDIIAATKDCVLAAFNVCFAMRFLDFELSTVGVDHPLPHFCLWYWRPRLGLGTRCRLEFACWKYGVAYAVAHEALAASQLFRCYLVAMRRQSIVTCVALVDRRSYRFNASFSRAPFPDPAVFGLCRGARVVPRSIKHSTRGT